MTQERLAELADLNIRTLQKIEAGKLNILVTTVLRLQQSLRCKWSELLPFDQSPPPNDPIRNKSGKGRPASR